MTARPDQPPVQTRPVGVEGLVGRIDAVESRALIAATGDIVYEHDYLRDRVAWGGTYSTLLGYSPEEMGNTGASWIERVHPADVPAVQREVSDAISQRRAAELEYRFRARDGSYRWFYDRGILELSAGGRLVRVVGIMRDVTGRRRTEHERDRFFELSLDLLCTAGPDGYFKRVNPSFSRVLGYSPAELVSRPYIEFVHPEDRSRTATQAGRLENGQPVMQFDNRYICRDGSVRWLSWNAAVDPGDGLIYAVARDMTERKQIEQHERLMARELDHRVKNTLAGVLAALEQSRAGAATPDELAEKLAGRLRAMGAAHELLARSRWKGADLRGAAAAVLTPFGLPEHFAMSGPDVTLSPRAAPVICMTLHELATNAAKHGALTIPGGRISLSWSVEPGPTLRLRWAERGGPPVDVPRRRGYGAEFIAGGIPYELGGTVHLDFAPEGVVCEITCPLRGPEER